MKDPDCPQPLAELEHWYRSHLVAGIRPEVLEQIKARVAVEVCHFYSTGSSLPVAPGELKDRIKLQIREDLTASSRRTGADSWFRVRRVGSALTAAAVVAAVLGIHLLLQESAPHNNDVGASFTQLEWDDNQELVDLEDELDDLEGRSLARKLVLTENPAPKEVFEMLDEYQTDWIDLQDDNRTEGVM